MRRELEIQIDDCVRLSKFFFSHFFFFIHLVWLHFYPIHIAHAAMQSGGLSTQRRCPWQNSTEQNENNFFSSLSFIEHIYSAVQKMHIRVYNQIDWMACVWQWCGCWPPPLIRTHSVFMLSVLGLLFDFISCLFVCAAQKKQLKNKMKKQSKWNENRLKLTHRRADLVLHMQFTSVSSCICMSFSCFEISSTECRSAKLTLCHCACVGRLFGFSFVQHFIFYFYFRLAHNREIKL